MTFQRSHEWRKFVFLESLFGGTEERQDFQRILDHSVTSTESTTGPAHDARESPLISERSRPQNCIDSKRTDRSSCQRDDPPNAASLEIRGKLKISLAFTVWQIIARSGNRFAFGLETMG